MKTYLLPLLVSVLLVSCSKDDDSNSNDDTMETNLYPKTAQMLIPDDEGELVLFLKFDYEFNSSKKVSSIQAEGFFGNENLYFSYGSNGMPSSVEVQNNQGTKSYNFHYTENKLSSISLDQDNFEVIHNSVNNTYSITKNGFTQTFTLNSMNDISRYYSLNPNGSDTLMQMIFDTTNKGFFSSVDMPLNFFTALVSDASTLLFTSHRPLVQIDADDVFTYQNEYDSDGFITESMASLGLNQTTIRFEYQEL